MQRRRVKTGLFIRGGWNGDNFWGRYYYRFPIGDRHTGYEWAIALADRHPYHPWLGELKGGAVSDMRHRAEMLEMSPLANAVYRELRAEVEADRLIPLRRAYCTDRPEVLDFTMSVFGMDQVLVLVRRREDAGWLIGKLLSMDTAGTADHNGENALAVLRQDRDCETGPGPADESVEPEKIQIAKRRKAYKGALAAWTTPKETPNNGGVGDGLRTKA
jgi:hypothetical protein